MPRRAQNLFAAQLEELDRQLVEGESVTGPAIPVTWDEMGRFADAYDRGLKRTLGFTLFGLPVIVVVASAVEFATGGDGGSWMTLGLTTALAVLLLLSHRRLLRAPAQSLQGRVPVAGALSIRAARLKAVRLVS